MYIRLHSFCHEEENGAQAHPGSSARPWDASAVYPESTFPKFS